MRILKKSRIIKYLCVFMASLVVMLSCGVDVFFPVNGAETYEQTLKKAGFPDSYIPGLKALHDKHPNWTFEAVNTGLYWINNDPNFLYNADGTINNANCLQVALLQEVALSRKLVPATGKGMSRGYADWKDEINSWTWYETPTAWRATDEIPGAFDWEENIWTFFDDGKSWIQASPNAIAYVMDPRNWINEDYIFMFEKKEYNEKCASESAVETVLEGSFMHKTICPGSNNKTYAWVIAEAGKKSGINPMHLATRLVQEKGIDNDELGKGVATKDGKEFVQATQADKEVYYNYFNINAGAGGGGKQGILDNGGKEAKNEGWTTPYLAIMGGASKVFSKYYNYGQDTLYFEMFSVVNPARNFQYQYAQNLLAPLVEGSKICQKYRKAGTVDGKFHFRIPIYKNMPSEPCPCPTGPDGNEHNTGNPNYKLKKISVEGTDLWGKGEYEYSLTPTFDMDTTSYSIIVPYYIEKITVSATPIAATSKITGGGEKKLSVGKNTVNIVCTSEYGTGRTYKVNITRQQGSTLLTSIRGEKVTFKEKFDKLATSYTATTNNENEDIVLDFVSESDFARVDVTALMKNSEKSTYEVSTKTCSNGKTPAIHLNEGENVIKFEVYPTAENTSQKTTYTVKIARFSQYSINFGKLVVSKDNKNISNLDMKQTVKTLLSKVENKNATLKVLDSKGIEKAQNANVGTGDWLAVYDKNGYEAEKYQVIIYGELNGDGVVDIFDFAYARKQLIKKSGLSGIFLEAADVYPDTKGFDVMDFAIIRRYIIKKTPIDQERNKK